MKPLSVYKYENDKTSPAYSSVQRIRLYSIVFCTHKVSYFLEFQNQRLILYKPLVDLMCLMFMIINLFHGLTHVYWSRNETTKKSLMHADK